MAAGRTVTAAILFCVQAAFSHACPASMVSSPLVAARAGSIQARMREEQVLFREVSAGEADSDADPSSLGHFDLASARRAHGLDLMLYQKLIAISTQGFPEEEKISHALLRRQLQERLESFALKEYEMPVTQLQGPHLDFADLPKSMPFQSAKDYELYLGMLLQVPRAFHETLTVLRQGQKDHLTPPRLLVDQVAVQCAGTIAEDPFLEPLQHFPASVSEVEQQRLTTAIKAAIQDDVLPAYRAFAEYMRAEYTPQSRTAIGLAALPDGAQRYAFAIRERTTTSMTAAQIHALGLSEVDRIRGLLLEVAHRAGYGDLDSFRQSLKSDPRLIPTSADQIVDLFRNDVGTMKTHLSSLFLNYPLPPLVIEAVPASQPNNGTHYVWASSDGKQPARVVVQTSDFAHRSLVSDETQAYHEGIPGHHLQISVQLQLKNLPEFRRHSDYAVFAEGWAVYAEALGKEIGMFKDPASDYGRLNLELMRAVRLVVDTGIHAQGWSREQAVSYYRQSGATDEPTTQAEVDMTIARPARNLAYQIGKLEILKLRHQAETGLGTRFDIREFHELILSGGNLPLDLVQSRVDTWIAARNLTHPQNNSENLAH